MFIVIEGLDGAGKSTQITRVQEWLTAQGREWEYLHFPRFTTPYFGEMIARFLRGELGALEQVDPQLVAMLYAGDRRDATPTINHWLAEDKVVLADRYVLSNIAYQCAKIEDMTGSETLKKWILGLEYQYNRIQRPDLTIFLDVPFRFTEAKLTAARQGNDRDYLKGKSDIHEASLTLQERVRQQYMLHRDNKYRIIECTDTNTGEMLSIETISDKIIAEISSFMQISQQ